MHLSANPLRFESGLTKKIRYDHTRGPALVLCGRHDVLCPLERHELMHTLLENSKLEIIEDAGHLPTLEQPKITTMALASWLEDT